MSDLEDRLLAAHREGLRANAIDLDALRAQVTLLRWARDRKAEVAEVEKTARAAIEEALGDNEAGTLDGELAVTWKAHKRRALDQKALKEAAPEIVEECMATSIVKRFEIL